MTIRMSPVLCKRLWKTVLKNILEFEKKTQKNKHKKTSLLHSCLKMCRRSFHDYLLPTKSTDDSNCFYALAFALLS